MGSYKEHQNLIKKFKLRLIKEFPQIRIFDRFCGLVTLKTGNKVKIGINGQSDCYAFFPSKHGIVVLEYEFKTGKARMSKVQRTWKLYIEKNGGFHCVVREDLETAIKETKEYLYEKKLL